MFHDTVGVFMGIYIWPPDDLYFGGFRGLGCRSSGFSKGSGEIWNKFFLEENSLISNSLVILTEILVDLGLKASRLDDN